MIGIMINYKVMEYWFDNIEKISIESHICQSEESKKEIQKFLSEIKMSISKICGFYTITLFI